MEVCLVLVSGKARISAGGNDFGVVGGRTSPFDGLALVGLRAGPLALST